eukprot:sb/3464733/
MFIAPSDPLEASIPEGYFTSSLTLEHVPLIANTWSNDMTKTPASDIHRSFIESYISDRQSLGVFHKDDPEEPVAWCTLYYGGAIGSLHVTKQHRGKKLGRVLLRTMARHVYETHGIGTFAQVARENVASQNLFQSEGWIKQKEIFEMNGCMGLQLCGSSEVSDVTDLLSDSDRFNLFHSFYRLKWNPGKSLLESYKCGSSKLYVLHGYELGAIGTSVLSVPDDVSSSQVEDFVRAAFRPEIADQISSKIFFFTIDSDKHIARAIEVVQEVLKQEKPILYPCQIYDMFIAPSNPLEADIPEGYFTGSLTLEHVPLIANTWSNDMTKTPATALHRSFIDSYISGRQSLGVFHKDNPGEPVAWCTLYYGGAIGSLHVTKQHRGKKLGRVLLRTMARRVYETHGIGTNARVARENVASQNLFLSEGWIKQKVDYTVFFIDKEAWGF